MGQVVPSTQDRAREKPSWAKMPVASDKPERHLKRGYPVYTGEVLFASTKLDPSYDPQRNALTLHTYAYLKTVPVASTKNLIFINKVLKT
jgi:hypothetical protein